MARDLTCSAVLLAIAGTYYAFASRISGSALSDEVGADGLPLTYAALLAALGAALGMKTLIAHFVKPSSAPSSTKRPAPTYVLMRAGGTLVIGGLYVAVVNLLGYWLSLALLLPAMAAYQGEPLGKRLIGVALIGATAFWLIFVWLLDIPLPSPWFLADA
jgi:putative tricarboxylic transport membrane protein